MIEHGHATHTGLRREHNEDTYWADAEHGLWLVADGMGGHGRGEVASWTAVDAVVNAIRNGIGMADAIRRAGPAVAGHAAQRHSATPMGSTLAALKLDDKGGYELARIGDSRIYRWQDGALTRISRAVMDGEPAESDATPATASTRVRATHALGITPTLELDTEPVIGRCAPGTQFLLCSDGLTEELDDRRIAAIVSRTDLAAQECVDQLVLAALDAGGRDNITVVLVRIR